jgi:hypothetical protein
VDSSFFYVFNQNLTFYFLAGDLGGSGRGALDFVGLTLLYAKYNLFPLFYSKSSE